MQSSCSCECLTEFAPDPEKLKKVDVVITSYSIVSNEHATFAPETKDESKAKGKKKSAQSDGDNSDDSDNIFKRAKKPAAKAAKKKDALFRVKWWRVVLGTYLFLQKTNGTQYSTR